MAVMIVPTDKRLDSEPFHDTDWERCGGHGMTFIKAGPRDLRKTLSSVDKSKDTDCSLPTIKTTGLHSASSKPKRSFPA